MYLYPTCLLDELMVVNKCVFPFKAFSCCAYVDMDNVVVMTSFPVVIASTAGKS